MNARGILSSLILGAHGVQMGTAFLTCDESGIHPTFKNILLQTKYDSTVLTTAFSGKLARGICNKFIERMKSNSENILPYPIQHALTSPMRRLAMNQNSTDFMSMWAGQLACLSKSMPAAQFIAELTTNVEKLMCILNQ
jgi:nitronate monooxygenase